MVSANTKNLVGYGVCLVLSWVLMWAGIFASGAGKSVPTREAVISAWVLCLCAFGFTLAAIAISRHTKRGLQIWEPVVTLGMMGVGSSIVVPVFISAQAASTYSACLSVAKVKATGFQIYMADFDDRLPNANRWGDLVGPYLGKEKDSQCPTAKTPYSYAMNSALSGVKAEVVESPADTALVFECEAFAPNPSGGQEWFLGRHRGRGSLGYVDGHARSVVPSSDNVHWKPKATP